jgi:hypothetical protein
MEHIRIANAPFAALVFIYCRQNQFLNLFSPAHIILN